MILAKKIINQLIENKEENYSADMELKLLKQAKSLKSAKQVYDVLVASDNAFMVNDPQSVRSCKYTLNQCIDVLELHIAIRDGKDTSKWIC